jgi:hypothetical protein
MANWKRGLFRLWVVFSVLWVSGFAVLGAYDASLAHPRTIDVAPVSASSSGRFSAVSVQNAELAESPARDRDAGGAAEPLGAHSPPRGHPRAREAVSHTQPPSPSISAI